MRTGNYKELKNKFNIGSYGNVYILGGDIIGMRVVNRYTPDGRDTIDERGLNLCVQFYRQEQSIIEGKAWEIEGTGEEEETWKKQYGIIVATEKGYLHKLKLWQYELLLSIYLQEKVWVGVGRRDWIAVGWIRTCISINDGSDTMDYRDTVDGVGDFTKQANSSKEMFHYVTEHLALVTLT